MKLFKKEHLDHKNDKWAGLVFLLMIFIIYKVVLIFVKMAYFSFVFNDSLMAILFLAITTAGLMYFLFVLIRFLLLSRFAVLYLLGGNIIIYLCNTQYVVVPNVWFDYNEYTNDLIDVITVGSTFIMFIYLYISQRIKLNRKSKIDDLSGELPDTSAKNQLDLF